jgi:hypothetical protein
VYKETQDNSRNNANFENKDNQDGKIKYFGGDQNNANNYQYQDQGIIIPSGIYGITKPPINNLLPKFIPENYITLPFNIPEDHMTLPINYSGENAHFGNQGNQKIYGYLGPQEQHDNNNNFVDFGNNKVPVSINNVVPINIPEDHMTLPINYSGENAHFGNQGNQKIYGYLGPQEQHDNNNNFVDFGNNKIPVSINNVVPSGVYGIAKPIPSYSSNQQFQGSNKIEEDSYFKQDGKSLQS